MSSAVLRMGLKWSLIRQVSAPHSQVKPSIVLKYRLQLLTPYASRKCDVLPLYSEAAIELWSITGVTEYTVSLNMSSFLLGMLLAGNGDLYKRIMV